MTDTDDIRASAEAGVDAPAWRDRKRYWWPLGLLIPLSPFLSWLLVEYLHLGLFWATGAWILILVIPIVDVAVGADGRSPPDNVIAALQDDRYYRWCTYCSCHFNTLASSSPHGVGRTPRWQPERRSHWR